MKKQFLLVAGVCVALTGLAQNDTTAKSGVTNSGDTIHVGSMIIVKNGNERTGDGTEVQIHRRQDHNPTF